MVNPRPLNLRVFIKRTNHYRFLASIIDHAVKRGDNVIIWHDCSGSKRDKKSYLFPHAALSPFFHKQEPNLRIEEIGTREAFYKEILDSSDVDFFLSLSPLDDSMFDVDSRILPVLSGKWAMIGHGQDTFIELTRQNRYLDSSYERLMLFETRHNLTLGQDWLRKIHPKVGFLDSPLTSIHFVGSTNVSKPADDIEKARIREKYHVPPNKNIVIYLPFPFFPYRFGDKKFALQGAWTGLSHNGHLCFSEGWEHILTKTGVLKPFWKIYCLSNVIRSRRALRWLLNGCSEVNLVKDLARFCLDNDFVLIGKPRVKFPFPPKLNDLCSHVIFDDESQQYPSILHELLQIAKLTVGSLSTAVLESVSAGVPYLNIEFPVRDQECSKDGPWYDYSCGSKFKFPGVATSVSVSGMSRFYWPESLLNFSSTAQEDYLRKFMFANHRDSVENVFDVFIEKASRAQEERCS